jgi:RNA polymerase sigma-70 factor (ECF subfamily)
VSDHTGDTGSFEELAMPHFARLFNLSVWLAQDRASAEDLVQETFMKALKGSSLFRQGTSFHAWICQILRNPFLTSQSGLKASVSFDLEDDGLPEPSTGETPESVLLARAGVIWPRGGFFRFAAVPRCRRSG